MNLFKKTRFFSVITSLLSVFMASSVAYAATSPGLGTANSLSILSSTYTNTASGTTLNGDLGYTVGPAVTPTVNGHTYIADSTYNQAGIDQGTALTALNVQPCTFSFATGAINLVTDTTHGTAGVYFPGVYCITGAASIGGGGTITLAGSGTYIFRMTGALNTSTNSIVALSSSNQSEASASACNIWWTPGEATTLGANSTFMGTDIDASGITIGSTITWTGRALAFGGTVSTAVDTINTVPACATTSTTPSTSSTPRTSGTVLGATTSSTPGLPNTGYAPLAKSTPWWTTPIIALVILSVAYLARKLNSKKHLVSLAAHDDCHRVSK